MSNCKPNVRAWSPIWYKVDCNDINLTSSDNTVSITRLSGDCCGWDLKTVGGGGGGGGTGSVTSIGITMPSAFAVTGSPITSAGTIAITMTGNTNQYLRGNGTLATFPTIPTPTTPNIDEVLSQGGFLLADRQMSIGSSVFSILNSSSGTILKLDRATEYSLGDLDGTDFGYKIKIEARNIFIGSELYPGNSIYIEDAFNRMTISSPALSISGNINVLGSFKLNSGSLGAGKVLTSDAFGVGTWQTTAANYWVSSTANNINNTNVLGVGIGVTSPAAALHIKAGTTTLAPLKFSSGGLLAAPVDGVIEYDGVNLYFTSGITRKIFPLGTTDTTIYTGNGAIGGPRVIDVQNNTVTWNNTGLFRIVEGNSTVGGTYDFNDGVDLLSFDAAHSSNLVVNSITGFSMEYTDVVTPALLTSLNVNGTGIKLTGIVEYTDNAAAIAAGLTAGYLYRTGDALKIVH